MAQFVSGGDLMFKSLLYGQDQLGPGQVMAQQAERFNVNSLTDAGNQFFEKAKDFYGYLNSTDTIRALKAAGRSIRSLWQTDEIRVLDTMGDMQHAPLSMQRWIMAEPTVRQFYHDQRIDGYSETYKDFWGDVRGEDHYDYRRVMDGIVVEDKDPETGEDSWHSSTWMEDLLPDETDLVIEEQADIIATWDLIKAKLKRSGEDPTSRYNSEVG